MGLYDSTSNILLYRHSVALPESDLMSGVVVLLDTMYLYYLNSLLSIHGNGSKW